MTFRSRRQFLSEAALVSIAAGALGAAYGDDAKKPDEAKKQPEPKKEPPKPPSKVPPSERLRVAVIGFNGRGADHIKEFAWLPDTEIAVVCDCDSSLAGKGIKLAETLQGSAPRFEQDLRKVMEDKSIDLVSIATPNHWHSLAAIWAVQAGKDVYVEKPVSHNVWEGRQLVAHARKHKRIVQAGTQSRSNPGMRDAIAFLHAGGVGEVKKARGLCYKFRPSIGEPTSRQPPQGVDYDLWCGPGPKAPLTRPKFHYDWHWFWDYGNGDLGNQGIHEVDKARWGLGISSLCDSVVSFGGRFGYLDVGETANTQLTRFTFGDKELIFEVRGLATADPFGKNRGRNYVGNIWYGSEGMVVCDSYSSGVALRPDGEIVKRFKGGGNHYANFVKAVRSRSVGDLQGDIEEGHLSSALCHLANISYRLGTQHPFAAVKDIAADPEMEPEFEKLKAHFADNKLKLNDVLVRCGLPLYFDPAAERFCSCQEANALLSREYRKGFEVTEA